MYKAKQNLCIGGIFIVLCIFISLTGCYQNTKLDNTEPNTTAKSEIEQNTLSNFAQLKSMQFNGEEETIIDSLINAPDFEQMLEEMNVDTSKIKFDRIKQNETQLVYKGKSDKITLNSNDWIVFIGNTSEHDFIYAYIQDKTNEFLGYGMIK